MTVKELISKLQEIEDDDVEVVINAGNYDPDEILSVEYSSGIRTCPQCKQTAVNPKVIIHT